MPTGTNRWPRSTANCPAMPEKATSACSAPRSGWHSTRAAPACSAAWPACTWKPASGPAPRTTCTAPSPRAPAPRPGNCWATSSPTTTTRAPPSPTPTRCAPAAARPCWPWTAAACANRSPTAPSPNSATNTASRSSRDKAHTRQHRGQSKGSESRLCPFTLTPVFEGRVSGGGSAFEDGGDAHAAGCADADEGAAAALFLQQLGSGGNDAGASGGEGVAEGQGAAHHVEPGAIDAAQRRLQAQLVPAELRILPGLERAQHLRREGLVDLVEIEVLQRQVVALEQLRHRPAGRHQQALAVHEVHRRHLRIHEVGLHFQAMRRRPFLAGQQRRRGAVGERGGIAGRQRALAGRAVEGGLERRQLLQGGVRAQDVVALDATERHHQIAVE